MTHPFSKTLLRVLQQITIPFLIGILSCPVIGLAQQTERQVEVGNVQWSNDWKAAISESKEDGKPLFVQFQEIPGCETCQDFGQNVLSHQLLVEAIEDNFHPLLVYNNRKGPDAKLLEQFNEPSWNNPVVRFLDANRKDLVPRKDRVWTAHQIADRMIAALQATGKKVPEYLRMVDNDQNSLSTATFAMHCFWEGEAKLGQIDGVHYTLAGWLDGKEVVELKFDPAVVPYAQLLKSAMKMECASTVFARSKDQHAAAKQLTRNVVSSQEESEPAKPSDRKYYLKHSPLKHLPLTATQQTKLNAALGSKTDWQSWLSPRQAILLTKIRRLLTEDAEGLADLEPLQFDKTDQAVQLAAYQQRLTDHLDQQLANSNR